MSRTIAKVQTNENHIINQLKRQTSIIDSTANTVKMDQETIIQELDDRLTQIINRINNSTEELYQQKIRQLFTTWSVHMTLILAKIQRSQASILDVLTDLHHGKINQLSLSPQQLQDELHKIKAYLPHSCSLPADNLLQIYKILSSEGRIVNNHALFRLKLPLIHKEGYELFRLIPIPVTINNTRIAIKPTTRILAINLQRNEFYPMTEHELSRCKPIEEMVFLCDQFHPIFSRRTAANTCEFNLFNNMPNIGACKLEIAENKSTWIHLSQPNHWMYALTEETTLNAVCNETAFQVTLEGAGILTLQPWCIVTHESLTIRGHHEYQS